MTIEWIRELCPEIAEWQAELIAQEIKSLRKANKEFAKRKKLWNEARAFELKEAVAEEREACAKAVERARLHMDGSLGLTHETDFIATRITDFLAAHIRARGDA